jgi:hypothetical protein
MERRFGMRGQVDMPVIQYVDGYPHECRVIDISPRGLVLQRSKKLAQRPARFTYWIELLLEGGERRIHVVARPVWTSGRFQAMRYVEVNEADRLEIAELLDRVHRRGALLH